MRKVRIAVGIALGSLCAGVLVPVIAQACDVNTIFTLGTKSGPPGSQVSVFGQSFANAPVDIYWASTTGPLLAVTQGPDFPVAPSTGVTITIPVTATPGPYYVYATDNTGPIAFMAQPFTVTTGSPVVPPPSQSPQPTQPAGQPQGSGSPPAPQPSSSGATSPSSAATPVNGPAALPNSSSSTNADSVGMDSSSVASVPAAPLVPTAPAPAPPQPAAHAQSHQHTQPALGLPNRGMLMSPGPPLPLVLGLALAGLTVLTGAGLGTAVLVRRRRAIAPPTRKPPA